MVLDILGPSRVFIHTLFQAVSKQLSNQYRSQCCKSRRKHSRPRRFDMRLFRDVSILNKISYFKFLTYNKFKGFLQYFYTLLPRSIHSSGHNSVAANIFFDEIGSDRLRKCDNGTFGGRVGAAQRNTLIILSSTLACRPYSHVGRL